LPPKTILRGHVENGRIVADEPVDLPEGTAVEIVADDDELSPEEHAEALASIERGLEQAARGETSPAEDVLRRLRAK
jgi:predicted DNA-binding antitoxin AbrB/MazE fold protein